MSRCIKTGVWLSLPQYGAFVRTDMHATENAYIFTNIAKDRFVFSMYEEDRGEVATVPILEPCFWQYGVLVVDPRYLEMNDNLEQVIGEMVMEYGLEVPQ